MENCLICGDKFNKTSKKEIKCSKCQSSCCLKCIKSWIESQNTQFKCFNCKVKYTYTFLSSILTKKFLDDNKILHNDVIEKINLEYSSIINSLDYKRFVEKKKINQQLEKLKKKKEEWSNTYVSQLTFSGYYLNGKLEMKLKQNNHFNNLVDHVLIRLITERGLNYIKKCIESCRPKINNYIATVKVIKKINETKMLKNRNFNEETLEIIMTMIDDELTKVSKLNVTYFGKFYELLKTYLSNSNIINKYCTVLPEIEKLSLFEKLLILHSCFVSKYELDRNLQASDDLFTLDGCLDKLSCNFYYEHMFWNREALRSTAGYLTDEDQKNPLSYVRVLLNHGDDFNPFLYNISLQDFSNVIDIRYNKQTNYLNNLLSSNEELDRYISDKDDHNITTNILCSIVSCEGRIISNEKKKEKFCSLCKFAFCEFCEKCYSPDTKHICLDSDKETVKTILSSTKNCPKCYSRITKIQGCDQMWCVVCKTAFSWNTGKIETGPIHNPHYHDWRRLTNQVEQNHNHNNGDNLLYMIDRFISDLNAVENYIYFASVYFNCKDKQLLRESRDFSWLFNTALENIIKNPDLELKEFDLYKSLNSALAPVIESRQPLKCKNPFIEVRTFSITRCTALKTLIIKHIYETKKIKELNSLKIKQCTRNIMEFNQYVINKNSNLILKLEDQKKGFVNLYHEGKCNKEEFESNIAAVYVKLEKLKETNPAFEEFIRKIKNYYTVLSVMKFEDIITKPILTDLNKTIKEFRATLPPAISNKYNFNLFD